MQISRFNEGAVRRKRSVGVVTHIEIHLDGGRNLNLAHSDAVFTIRAHRSSLRLEHDRRMADVMADPKVATVVLFGQMLLKERDEIFCGIEDAPWLGLKVNVHQNSSALMEFSQSPSERTKLCCGISQIARC